MITNATMVEEVVKKFLLRNRPIRGPACLKGVIYLDRHIFDSVLQKSQEDQRPKEKVKNIIKS